jgi:hypothetical protein
MFMIPNCRADFNTDPRMFIGEKAWRFRRRKVALLPLDRLATLPPDDCSAMFVFAASFAGEPIRAPQGS